MLLYLYVSCVAHPAGVQYPSPWFQPREQGTHINDKTYFALTERDNNRIT